MPIETPEQWRDFIFDGADYYERYEARDCQYCEVDQARCLLLTARDAAKRLSEEEAAELLRKFKLTMEDLQ